MAETGSHSQFFSGNIANIIPGSPLKKMIPLMEDHGGCMGTPIGLWTTGTASIGHLQPVGNIKGNIINSYTNHNSKI